MARRGTGVSPVRAALDLADLSAWPRRPCHEERATKGSHTPRTRVARRVLIVEDSPDARPALRALLRRWGHEAADSEDGHAGVRQAREFHPEIAIVDIGLPGLDGYQVGFSTRAGVAQLGYPFRRGPPAPATS